MLAQPIPQLAKHEPETVAILLCTAISFFFSFFVGLFIGSERSDGLLRNKVMAGHSQKRIFLAHYLTLFTAVLVMQLCWLLGALAAGAALQGRLIRFFCIALLLHAAYIALLLAICFRLKKNALPLSLGLYFILFTVMEAAAILYRYSISEGAPALGRAMAILYNISPIGQCVARCSFVYPDLSRAPLQISVSLAVLGLALFAGTLRLNKRNIE